MNPCTCMFTEVFHQHIEGSINTSFDIIHDHGSINITTSSIHSLDNKYHDYVTNKVIASPLLASMTIQSTISPFVIDDNTHSATYASPFIMLIFYNIHQQLMLPLSSCFSSLPLWHQWQRVPIF